MKIQLATLIFIAGTMPSFAQIEVVAQHPWQLSLDVIKDKAQQLVTINHQLTTDHDNLAAGIEKLKSIVAAQAEKNKILSEALAKRAGRTDQQIELDDISAKISAAKQDIAIKQKQVLDLNKQVQDVERLNRIKKLRLSDWEIGKKAKEMEISFKKSMEDSSVPTTADLNETRKELEKQKGEEASLEAKINELTRADSTHQIDLESLNRENSQLQSQLDALMKEVAFRDREKATDSVDKNKYNSMVARKKALEAKIKAYEARIDGFKNPSNFTLSWDKEKKRIIHAMVQADSRNQQLRSNIDNLKEDIGILRDNVAKLERRINFSKGKGYDDNKQQ